MKFKWGFGLGLVGVASCLVFAGCGPDLAPADAKPTITLGVTERADLSGDYVSKCTRLSAQDGVVMYSILKMNFFDDSAVGADPATASTPSKTYSLKDHVSVEETAYQDKDCTITHFKIEGLGSFTPGPTLLRIAATSIRMTALHPSMVDELTKQKSCGKTWTYGSPNEILGTECMKDDITEYSMSKTLQGIDFYDCKGETTVNTNCIRYEATKKVTELSTKVSAFTR